MPNVLDAPASDHQVVWIGVAALCIYYIVFTVVFHWSSRQRIGVTRYEPPKGISPGVAAYLIEGGRCERAFAAALISLAAKGYIEIKQQKDWFGLEKLREPDGALPLDESIILVTLFYPASIHTYKFNGRDYSELCETFKKFRETVEGTADPRLISAHSGVWWVGVWISYILLALVIASFPGFA